MIIGSANRFAQAAGGGGGSLPARNDVNVTNVFNGVYTSGGQTISSNSEDPGENVYEAFDNDQFTFWGALANDFPNLAVIDFGSAQVVYSVCFTPRVVVNMQFYVDSSDDNLNWTERLGLTSASSSANPPPDQFFDLDTPAEARYWRVRVISSTSQNRARVANIFFRS